MVAEDSGEDAGLTGRWPFVARPLSLELVVHRSLSGSARSLLRVMDCNSILSFRIIN